MKFKIVHANTPEYRYYDFFDKYYVSVKRTNGMKYLHSDGVVRTGTGPKAEGWFDTPEDVIEALNLFYSKTRSNK